MPFIRFNGWGLDDIPRLLSSPGQTNAFSHYSDNTRGDDDPLFIPQPISNRAITVEEIKDLYTKTMLESTAMEPWDEIYRSDETVMISKITIATVLEVARLMTHKSVCVIFGRDMYPAQEVIRVFGHKLRGTWIYIEGASRGVVNEDTFRKGVNNQFGKLFKKADTVIGVDTGFGGSVPHAALIDNPYISAEVKTKVKIKLICCSSSKRERRLFYEDYEDYPEAWLRGQLSIVEQAAKPFVRSYTVDKDGWPILNISNRKSIAGSALIMARVREDSKKELPYVSLYMDKSVDILNDFYGVKTFGGAIIKHGQEGHMNSEEKIVFELFGLMKPTCDCTSCTSQDAYKKKYKELIKQVTPSVEEEPPPVQLMKFAESLSWTPAKGDKIKLKDGSRFSSQMVGTGVVLCDSEVSWSPASSWYPVKWENGCKNTYQLKDMILIDSPIRVGDWVIGISHEYTITNKGWIGQVTELYGNGYIHVKGKEQSDSFYVKLSCFEKCNPLAPVAEKKPELKKEDVDSITSMFEKFYGSKKKKKNPWEDSIYGLSFDMPSWSMGDFMKTSW